MKPVKGVCGQRCQGHVGVQGRVFGTDSYQIVLVRDAKIIHLVTEFEIANYLISGKVNGNPHGCKWNACGS
jgi:hypothetical protein